MCRSRALAAAPVARGALLAVLIATAIASCSTDTVEAYAALRLETQPQLPLLHVPHNQVVHEKVLLRNPTAHAITLRKGSSSCSCVTIEDQARNAIVPAGGQVEIALRIHSTRTGLKYERLLFKASTGSMEPEFIAIPIALLTGSPIFTQPRSLRVTGAAGARIEDAFKVSSYTVDGSATPLHWDTGDTDWALAPTVAAPIGLSSGALQETSFALTIPDLAPGAYAFPIEFWRMEGQLKAGQIDRSLALLITQ